MWDVNNFLGRKGRKEKVGKYLQQKLVSFFSMSKSLIRIFTLCVIKSLAWGKNDRKYGIAWLLMIFLKKLSNFLWISIILCSQFKLDFHSRGLFKMQDSNQHQTFFETFLRNFEEFWLTKLDFARNALKGIFWINLERKSFLRKRKALENSHKLFLSNLEKALLFLWKGLKS